MQSSVQQNQTELWKFGNARIKYGYKYDSFQQASIIKIPFILYQWKFTEKPQKGCEMIYFPNLFNPKLFKMYPVRFPCGLSLDRLNNYETK